MARYRRVCLALICASVSSWAFGQEQPDSLSLAGEAGMSAVDIEELTRPLGSDTIVMPLDAGFQRPLRQELPLSPTFATADPYHLRWQNPSYSRVGILPRWSTGYMYGSHAARGAKEMSAYFIKNRSILSVFSV